MSDSKSLPTNPWDTWGWAFASIWLVFLVYPILATVGSDASPVAKTLTLGAIAGFAVANILGYSERTSSWYCLGVMVALGLATVPVIGIEAIGFTPYLAMLSALRLPAPAWGWILGVWAAVPLLALLRIDGFPPYFFLMVWPVMFGGAVLRIFDEREDKVHQARSEFALVSERERVARDVHDVLGHSLTALSIKAELASRLIETDPARAKAELESIQDIARQSLSEVRATVGGLRAANLDAELAAAPRVLADAGISTTVKGEVADTDPRHRALLAWVLREAVTNVVRHAGAGSVAIELGPHGLTVTDDGIGTGTGTGPDGGLEGNGLRGMRERVSAAGGRVEIGGSPGTVLQVVLP